MTYSKTAAWLRRWRWVGLVIGCVPWTACLISLAIGGWYKAHDGLLVGADHLAFYHAAKLVREGESHRMYDYLELSNEGYQQKIIGWDWPGFEAYRNPPFYALLYVPTTALSYYASFIVWTLIGFELLWFALWLLAPRRVGDGFVWALAFFPVYATAIFGQNTFISLAIFAGVYRLLCNERPFAAGLVAGLLWFKPQLLLGLFVWWAFEPRRYARCWLGVAVIGLLLAAVSWLAVPGGSRAFVDTIRTNAGFSGFGLWNVVNPKGFFALLLSGVPWAHWPLAGMCSLLSIAVAWRVKQKSGAPVAVMFPVAVFLSLWASPHALIYEWALLIAAGAVLWESRPASRDVWLCLFALAWVGLGVTVPLAFVQIAKFALPVVVQAGVPVMGIVGWLVARELMRSLHEQPGATFAQLSSDSRLTPRSRAKM